MTLERGLVLERGVVSRALDGLLEVAKERGLEEIPNCYYRDDGLELWDIILKFVKGVLSYYCTDCDVKDNTELKAWLNAIFHSGFLQNKQAGFPKSFSSVEELVRFVTMMIFTVSAQHAAVNNGQFDYGGRMPNFPSSLQLPPPKRKGLATEDTITAALPSVSCTVNTMAIVYLLCSNTCDRMSPEPSGHEHEHKTMEWNGMIIQIYSTFLYCFLYMGKCSY
ncbi:polyunsaturated fatty acid lipoxygenase ALOX15B-like [Brachyhypopomus gauderio]|uniref:polyunsaturated fatty acid lipoxygenase ALOX15B-like n=1 Tax=Brachyhypopomus gauderio TaxID=698409 RepID=UPI004041A58C